jgi:signal transduction histidine kinase
MSLRAKLLLALAPLVLVLIALGVVSVRSITGLAEGSQLILQDNYRSVLAAQRMKEAIERTDSAALFLVAGHREEALAQATPNLERFEAELLTQQANITEPGEADATRELRGEWDGYRVLFGDFIAARRGTDLNALYFQRLFPAFGRVKAAADRILAINQDAMVLKSDRARRAAQQSIELMVGATLGAFLVGLLASAGLVSRLLRPLRVLTQAVRRIGEGDMEARAQVQVGDEIGKLAGEFNTMAQKLGEYRRSSLGDLLEAQQASQAAIDSLPDPVLVFATDGTLLNVNDAADALFHIEVSGGQIDPLGRVPPDVRSMLERVRARVMSGKGPYSPKGFEEAIPVDAAEGTRYLLPRATPLYSETGGISGATVVLQDVTRLMRFDELKNDLVATVAHEFRTPLTSLRMAIHLCLEGAVGELTEKQADLLQTARNDCERLQSIVDDLLDLSRIRSGKVEVAPVPLTAKTLVEGVVAEQMPQAQDKGVRLRGTVVEPVLPVLADPERISLVLTNLIANAVSHSPRGAVVELRADPEDRRVRFQVLDQGTGIPPEYQERIFEKFFRVPGTRGEGIGLGLYISREIVRAHGGDMGVDSQPGHGSRFWFTLPVAGLA